MIQIAASILGADLLNIENEIKKIYNKVDILHYDVMDGYFVPNHTFGMDIFKKIHSKFPAINKEVHLMVQNPIKFVDYFLDADLIAFHPKSGCYMDKTINYIKSKGIDVALALDPDEPFENFIKYFDQIEEIIIMGVYAGFTGQQFLPEIYTKISNLRKIFKGKIEIDGGVNDKTADELRKLNVDIILSGSFLFKGDIEQNIAVLKGTY